MRPLHPLFVAEVEGVDLRSVVEPKALDEFRALMDSHAVLVVRGQTFDDSEQVAFARRFDGDDIHLKSGRAVIDQTSRLGDVALTDISNLDETGAIMGLDDRRRMYALANRLWHTDVSFQIPAGRYSMLSCKSVATSGGETEYADMRAAYDSLPEKQKDEIANLRAFHSIVYSRETIGFDQFSERERGELPGAEQPLVRTIPRSGRKALYLASHASHIVGWPLPEGRLLLRGLTELATQQEFVYRHTWRVGDLVIWDNRCTMHRGLPFDEANERRDLRRVTTLDVDRVAATV